MTDETLSDEFVERMEEKLKKRLRSLRQDVSQIEEEALSSRKESSGDLSSTPEHNADVGTDTFEQNRNIDEIKREQKEIDQIQNALDKITEPDTKAYGRCEECDEPIGEDRLNAIPYTPYCIDCAEASEQSGENR